MCTPLKEDRCMPRNKRLRKKSELDGKTVDDSSDEILILDSDDENEKNKPKQAKEKKAAPKETIEMKKPALIEREFDSEDQALLSQNEHFRFMPSSQVVAHALVTKAADGKIIAQQFTAPGSNNPEDPQVKQVTDIEIFIDPFGARRARAKTTDGTDMISKRSVDVETTDEHGKAVKHELLLFSPKSSHIWRGDVFWGSNPTQRPPLFKPSLSKAHQKELDKEMKEAKDSTRGGELDIVHHDVPLRENQVRKPSQNDVMKRSAIDSYEEFYDEYQDELSDDMKFIFKKSIDARDHVRTFGMKSQPRPEWCHALGFGLTPLDQNPQRSDNLAAAPKWLNTKMMTTERAIKWHAMNRPGSDLHLSCQFKMIPHSDILEEGTITGSLKEGDREVKLSQHLNPHQKYPVYSKPTDLAQTTLIAHHLLTDKPRAKVEEVRIAPRLQTTYEVVTQPSGYGQILVAAPLRSTPSATSVGVESVQQNATSVSDFSHHPSSSSNSSSTIHVSDRLPTHMASSSTAFVAQPQAHQKITSASIDDLTTLPNAPLSTVTRALPTSYLNQQSVVKVFSTFQQPDYEMPWLGSIPNKCTGSGFVVSHKGRHYVVTNAHVVEDTNYLEVRLANDDRTFTAKPKQVSYQADIALLEIEDPEFQEITQPVELGDMAQMQEEVRVVGFPMGGEELSITKGIVSRIEVDTYAESGERMLQVQTDSAVNPGNSGGPVFSGNKLVGIAFQGYDAGQNLGYFIPMPVLKHFLQDAFSGEKFKGVPTLNISVQPLSNKGLKDFFGLKKDETGVRINAVDDLSDAKTKLFEDDIILAVDGIKVGNDGKVTVPEVGNRIDFNYLFQRKQIGEAILVDVLRKNLETGVTQRLRIPVTLEWRPGQTKKVEAPEHETDPTYYIHSGVVFQPLTNNYLETQKGSALRDIIIPQVGYITDIPKKAKGEQFVVINQVLDSKETSGYTDFENALVSEVNGTKVNNMDDVVRAMDAHKGQYHHIKCLDGDIIVIKNLEKREHEKLLKQYRIHHDRSENLRDQIQPLSSVSTVAEPSVLTTASVAKAVAKQSVSFAPSVATAVISKEKEKVEQKKIKQEPREISELEAKKQALQSYLASGLSDSSDDESYDEDADSAEDAVSLSGEEDSDQDLQRSGEDLFRNASDEDDDEESSLDGFIVSGDEDDNLDEDNLPEALMVPRVSMLHMAERSGKKYTMSDLSFMDTIDQLEEKYCKKKAPVVKESESSSDDEALPVSRHQPKKALPKRRIIVESDSESESDDAVSTASVAATISSEASRRTSRRLAGLKP